MKSSSSSSPPSSHERSKRWRYTQECREELKKCKEDEGKWTSMKRGPTTPLNQKNKNGTKTPFTEYLKKKHKRNPVKIPEREHYMWLSGRAALPEDDVTTMEIKSQMNSRMHQHVPEIRKTKSSKEESKLSIEGLPVHVARKNKFMSFPSTFVHEKRLLRVRQSKNMDLYTPDTRFEDTTTVMAPWTRRGHSDST